MPPKKVTMAPGTKPAPGTRPARDEKSAKSDKSGKSRKGKPTTQLSMDKVNPIQRPSKIMTRTGDLRKQRDAYNQVIEEEKAQKEREIRELREKIVFYKKDNEKLLRQQTAKFGLTLDNLQGVKEELEQARSTNDNLYREVEARKEECDKLQMEMDEVIRKINELMIESSDLNRERRTYEREREQVARNEIQIHHLVHSNRELRNLLLKHKINPNTDASRIHVKSKSPRSEPSQSNIKLPTIYNKQNLMSFRTAEELRPVHNKKPIRGILRRSKSTNQTEYMTAREFFRRRTTDPLTKVVEVFI